MEARLKTFVVFEPAGGARGRGAADRVVVLREKFSWPALFFAPFWLLWHGLWVGFFGWVLVGCVIAALAIALDLDTRAAVPALLLPNFLLAFEASELRRRKLLRQGFREAGVIVADDLEAAERRYFAASDAQPEAGVPPSSASVPTAPSSNAIVGLFPEPGARP
jgi:hypothetical protein